MCPFSRVPREHSAAVLLPFFVRPVIRQMGWLSSFSHDGTLQCSCYCKDKEKKTPSSGTLAITPNTELCARMYAFMHASVGPAPRCLAPLDFLCIRPAPPECFFFLIADDMGKGTRLAIGKGLNPPSGPTFTCRLTGVVPSVSARGVFSTPQQSRQSVCRILLWHVLSSCIRDATS